MQSPYVVLINTGVDGKLGGKNGKLGGKNGKVGGKNGKLGDGEQF